MIGGIKEIATVARIGAEKRKEEKNEKSEKTVKVPNRATARYAEQRQTQFSEKIYDIYFLNMNI